VGPASTITTSTCGPGRVDVGLIQPPRKNDHSTTGSAQGLSGPGGLFSSDVSVIRVATPDCVMRTSAHHVTQQCYHPTTGRAEYAVRQPISEAP
jgi:hypothetical protein